MGRKREAFALCHLLFSGAAGGAQLQQQQQHDHKNAGGKGGGGKKSLQNGWQEVAMTTAPHCAASRVLCCVALVDQDESKTSSFF